jgi:hypothetical protein
VAWTWQKAHRSGYEPPQAMILWRVWMPCSKQPAGLKLRWT